MSDQHEREFPEGPPSADGDHIGSLLRLAGPREAVPADRMRRVKAAVRADWRQQTRARSRRITIGWSLSAVAAAALVILGVRLAVRDRPAVQGSQQDVASIDAVSGTSSFQIDDRIQVGDAVDTTTGGRIALRLASGASVRLDRGTRVRLSSDAAMVLEEGVIYVDSGNTDGARSLEIRTKVGVVQDIGTRFEVRLNGSALRVRVRDGVVRLSQSRQSHDARSGDELTLDGSGSVLRRTIPVHGADWAWAAELGRTFNLEGRSLRDFLDWIVGENGWLLQFADAAVEEKSRTAIMHGSIEGLTPEEALSSVLPASGFGYQLENGILRVRQGTGDAKN